MTKKTTKITNANQVVDVHSLQAYVNFLMLECRIPVAEYHIEQQHPWIRLRRKPKNTEVSFLRQQGMIYSPRASKGSNRRKEIFVYSES